MQALSPVDHRSLFGLAWPILVTMLSYTLLTVVNSIYVGWLGTAELAAIGLSTAAIYLVQSFGLGWLGAVRVLVANRTGAGQAEEAARITWVGLGVALAAGLGASMLVPLGPWLFSAMGASEEVLPHAVGYFTWRVLPTPIVFLFTALQGAAQGRSDTRGPMFANLLANAVNLALDPLLIFGFGPVPALGIEGAAIGAAIGVLSGLVLLAARCRVALGVPSAQMAVREHIRALWSVGSPMGTQFFLDVGSYTILSSLLAGSGDAHLAAHVIVVRVIMFAFLPCNALGEATSVLVGQSLGARMPERARRALVVGATQAALFMALLGIVLVSIPGRLVAVFGAAEDVAAIAAPIIVLYACIQVLDGVVVVIYGALTGAGDTRFTMRAALSAAWLVKLPIAGLLVLRYELGAYGAWLGIGAEIVFVLLLGLWRVRSARWLEVAPMKEIEPEGAPEAVPAK